MSHVKFVVQSLPRCGAGLVMSALGRHPQCETRGTAFVGDTPQALETMLAAGSWKTLFDRCTRVSGQQQAAGFISYRYPPIMQSGMCAKWEWTQTLWRYISDKGSNDVRVLSVRRMDPIARAISAALELFTGVAAARKNSDALRQYIAARQPVTIPPWLFRTMIDEWLTAETLPQGRAKELEITYEDTVHAWTATMETVQQFLGLDVVELTTPLARLGCVPPHTLVANWDIVMEAFKSTRYEQYFEKYVAYYLPMYMKQAGGE